MIGSRAWRALMRRNLIYRKRSWIGTILELGLPLLFLGFLVLIKRALENSDSFDAETVNATIPSDDDAFKPLSFQDYVTAMQAERQCVIERNSYTGKGVFKISGIEDEGYNWQVPFVKCDSRKCQKDQEDAQRYCEYGVIGVSPSSSTDEGGQQRAADFKEWLLDRYPALTDNMPFDFDAIKDFENPKEMERYVKKESYGEFKNPKIIMGIVWDGNDPNNWIYSLRQNSTNFNAPERDGEPGVPTTPNTDIVFKSFAKNDEQCGNDEGADQGPFKYSCTGQYLYNGILTFQRLIGDFILNQTGAAAEGYTVSQSGVTFVPFPAPEYVSTGFYDDIQRLAPLMITLGLLYPVAAMIGYITREKELGQKELIKMMSVTESDIGWAWWTNFFAYHIITATALAGLSTVFYEHSEWHYLWGFWILTMLSIVVFSMAISTLTSKSTRGVLIGLLLFFLGVFLTIALDYQDSSGSLLAFLSLHPVAAFGFGLQEIGHLEDLGVGVTSSTFDWTDNPSDYTFQKTMRFLIMDAVIWGLVSAYLTRVIKPAFGQARCLWFPVQDLKKFIFRGKSQMAQDDDDFMQSEEAYSSSVPFEFVGDNMKRQSREGKNIQIHDLRKTFGEKIAVEGLNLSIYRGQITALLGHNGAGKTTVISMLTGALAPTSGYATVAGKDIRTEMPEIRKDIGICLQHNCLFPQLTVREHVQFFSRLKGLYRGNTKEEAEDHIDQAIKDVALFEKRNTFSRNLSGGMKRKLSVAIAFCGGSKVVYLDEPTSGMDPFSRRFTWNVIRQYRQDRCIVLTTHFMDEADILGDRIAIMAEGHLRCCGSSLFLKKTYGVGYQLNIEKCKEYGNNTPASQKDDDYTAETDEESKESDHNGTLMAGLHMHDDTLKRIVKSAVHEARLLSNVGTVMSFQLPMGAASGFPSMFEGLDEEIKKGTISSYGVSVTTLDEVFLKVARGEERDKMEFASSTNIECKLGDDIREAATTDDLDKSARGRMDLAKQNLFFTHLGALFKKRAANFRRDKRAWIFTAILPSLFVLIGFVVAKYAFPESELDPILLTLDDYNSEIDRNPIVVNSPGSPYTCQPGACAYQAPIINRSDELYYFCGEQARLLDAGAKCTISESAETVGRLTDIAGASAEPTSVETIFQSSESLAQSADDESASQYGAIFFTHELDSGVVDGGDYNASVVAQCALNIENSNASYTSLEDCVRFGGYGYVIQYNITAPHISPLFQTLADEALVRQARDLAPNEDFSIRCTIAPLPITKDEEGFNAGYEAFVAWFLVVLSFPFIGGAFATFVVAEKQSKAKHLQTVAGVQASAYWISTFLWDVLNYQIPLWITVILMFAFDVEVLTTREQGIVGGVMVLLLLYGPASAGFAYCASFAFDSPSLANLSLIIFNFLIGMGGSIAVTILLILGNDVNNPRPSFVDAAHAITWILRFFPSFCLAKGLYFIINIEYVQWVEGENRLNAWSEAVMLVDAIYLAWESIVYLALAIQIDKWSTNPRVMRLWKKFCCFCGKKPAFVEADITTSFPQDDDVVAEQERVLTGEAKSDLIVLSQLTKVFDNGTVAVNNMSLGIPRGECFGLLGINGAGKTTALQMVTAEFPPTSGDVTLAGYSVTSEPEKTRRRIGYCPQFDAHFANMTGREHVELYASIKGIPKEFLKEATEAKLREVGLNEKDADRLAAVYSGGMKRRLSLACAMIGQPQIMLLDECTTGVDPVARREIWQLISDMVAGANLPEEERVSIILTTHSMEECEALCPMIGIMADGRLRCLGSAQHLKNKFGQGFQIELKVKLIDKQDQDYVLNAATLAQSRGIELDEEATSTRSEDVFFNLEEALGALQSLTGDDYLSSLITPDNPAGYNIYKNACIGVEPLDELAAFATIELRMRNLETFVHEKISENAILRERQEAKARYEVPSEAVQIAALFAMIEENKEKLMLSDYGVSQTSLEQVFNMHAAEAERLKEGRTN